MIKKNRIKAINRFIIIVFCVSLIFGLLHFFTSKFTGFENNNLVPGSSTVGHPLVTSYSEGLKYWKSFLFDGIIAFILFFLFFYSKFVNAIEKRLDQKDEYKKSIEEKK